MLIATYRGYHQTKQRRSSQLLRWHEPRPLHAQVSKAIEGEHRIISTL